LYQEADSQNIEIKTQKLLLDGDEWAEEIDKKTISQETGVHLPFGTVMRYVLYFLI
jgi:hypothetical protein